MPGDDEKTAFSTSAYSGPLNPVILSGASYLPPRKPVQLQSAIQKTAWSSFLEELVKQAAMSMPELQEFAARALRDPEVRPVFTDAMLEAGLANPKSSVLSRAGRLPPATEAARLDRAAHRAGQELIARPERSLFNRVFNRTPPTSGAQVHPVAMDRARGAIDAADRMRDTVTQQNRQEKLRSVKRFADRVMGGPVEQALPGLGALAAVGGYAHFNQGKEDEAQAPSALRGRLGAHLVSTVPLSMLGASIGGIHPRGRLVGGLLGGAGGTYLGEKLHAYQDSAANQHVRGAFARSKDDPDMRKGQLQRMRSGARDTTGETTKKMVEMGALMPGVAWLYGMGPRGVSGTAAGLASIAQGTGLVSQYRKRLMHQKATERAGREKAAAGAPTRGNFMMASDIPPFREPHLDRAIQKEGDMLGDYITYSPGDFKRVDLNKKKYAMSTEDLGTFVSELLKGASPSSELRQSQSVGAPRATPPKGPSISTIAKATGPGTGNGMAGAFNGTIGTTAPVALK